MSLEEIQQQIQSKLTKLEQEKVNIFVNINLNFKQNVFFSMNLFKM